MNQLPNHAELASLLTKHEHVLLTILAAIQASPHSHTYGSAEKKVKHAVEITNAYFKELGGI